MMELSGLTAVSAPLPWQAQTWMDLNQQLEMAQLPHALLLSGTQYAGKSRLALALARLLLCRDSEGGLNCGHCHACELSASGGHGDFRWLQPEEKSRVIKIDQVRGVVDFTNKTASLGQRKVVVLAPADRMNSNAANALLKSLEEPAADTYLILVCHRLHGVPATIRSRCRLLKLPLPDAAQSLAWLDTITGERAQSESLLGLAQGRPLLAEQLFRSDSAETLAATCAALQGLISGKIPVAKAAVLLAEVEISEFLAQCVTELEGFVRSLPREQLQVRQGRAAFLLLDEVLKLQRAVDAGANPNRQLLVETMLAKVHRELGAARLDGNIVTQRGDVRL